MPSVVDNAEADFDVLHRIIKRADTMALRRTLGFSASANLQNRYGFSLLMMAAAEGNVPIGELLISRGADPNRVSRNGWSALGLAIARGHVPFLRLLLQHGAHPNWALHGMPIEKWILAYRLSPKKETTILKLLQEYRPKTPT